MRTFLVDTNVLIDVARPDPIWYAWSSATLMRCVNERILAINPIIYAELGTQASTPEQLDLAVPPETFMRLPLPWHAAWRAGQQFNAYRRAGGNQERPDARLLHRRPRRG